MEINERIWLLLGVLFVFGPTIGLSEIHRAKSLNAKLRPRHHNQYQYPLWPPNYGRLLSLQPLLGYDPNQTAFPWLHDVVWGHEAQTWIFSIVSASLVGLSGIFPLIVIPIEAGKSLRSGAANSRLKLLLSFAVGGLLGDVFLHLLPETWAHLQKKGGEQKGQLHIGLWLLTGLLSFFIIQKVFPEEEEEEEEEEENELEGKEKEEEVSNEARRPGETTQPEMKIPNYLKVIKDGLPNNRSDLKLQNVKTDEPTKKKGMKGQSNKNEVVRGKKSTSQDPTKKGSCLVSSSCRNRFKSMTGVEEDVLVEDRKQNGGGGSGCCTEGTKIGWVDSLRSWVLGDTAKEESQSLHIKTSGWLNLVANMIDNFTHGLAVAGSYSISTKTGLLTTVAILLHEIPHEIGDFAILLKAGFDRWRAAKAQLLTATGGMLGALIALAAESTKEAGESTAWILPFTAGGFIYIALVTVVPDLLKETNPWHSLKQFISLCAGIATMALVSVLVD